MPEMANLPRSHLSQHASNSTITGVVWEMGDLTDMGDPGPPCVSESLTSSHAQSGPALLTLFHPGPQSSAPW